MGTKTLFHLVVSIIPSLFVWEYIRVYGNLQEKRPPVVAVRNLAGQEAVEALGEEQ
jgi:hypothetical protein